MANVIELPSRDLTEYDLLPGYIPRSNSPDSIDLSAPLRKYSDGEEDGRYRIRVGILSASMQCISGTPENISSNLGMYEFTGAAGLVNCTQPLERQVRIVKRLRETGATIIPAAIDTHDYKVKVPSLVDAGANLLFVDTSQGYTEFQKETIQWSKSEFRALPVIGGNIVTAEGFHFLVDKNRCNSDGVKVGMGVGAGCITSDVLGVSRKQATAIMDVARARDGYYKKTGIYVPIIADGGIKTFSDITKAYAFGADAVMVGRLIAGCPETPNPVYQVRLLRDNHVVYEGQAKEFWYEASRRARMLSEGPIRDYSYRYEEGKEGWVKVTLPMKEFLNGGFRKVRDAVRKAGCQNIPELHENAVLELAMRTTDPNDPDIAIWDSKYVQVFYNSEWIPSTELPQHTTQR